jgi:ankyrin repeat protein
VSVFTEIAVDWQDELEKSLYPLDLARAEIALKNGANPNVVFAVGSPIEFAAEHGLLAAVQLFIRYGASPDKDETELLTALHAAAEKGHLQILQLLLHAGAKSAIEGFDYIDRTPLMCAVEAGHLAIVKELIRQGADVNAHNVEHVGNTALHFAVEKGNLKMIKELLDAGADPTIPGWMSLRPIDKVKGQDVDEIRALLAAKVRHDS